MASLPIHRWAMQNSLEIVAQALKQHLTAATGKGLYYQAYFHLVERVGREAEEQLGRGLSGAEALLISVRVESFLKERVFRSGF